MDLRDAWRPGSGLTLRRLVVLVRHLPRDSTTIYHLLGAEALWDTQAYLLADVVHALTGKPHPGKPKPRKSPTALAIQDHKLRDLERRRQLRQQNPT